MKCKDKTCKIWLTIEIILGVLAVIAIVTYFVQKKLACKGECDCYMEEGYWPEEEAAFGTFTVADNNTAEEEELPSAEEKDFE